MSARSVLAALAFSTLFSAVGEAQGNALTLSNGGEVVFPYSVPSVGAPTGTFPPSITGDLFWKVIPGQALGAGPGTVAVTGFHETIYDTDWSTPASLYDRSFDPVVPSASGNLEPAYFTTGTVGQFVSLGGGFGSPCTISPSLCSPGGCMPPGFLVGWAVDVSFAPGFAIPIPADNVNGTALSYYVPGGMSTTGGSCGAGDYVLQDVHSTDETQADVLGNGISPFGGFQIAGSGPLPEQLASTFTGYTDIGDGIVQMVADSGTGLGFEGTGGGALNGVNLAVGGGSAKVKAMVSCAQCPPGLAFAAASLSPIPPPGLPFAGEALLIAPFPPFQATLSIWQGPHVGATLLPEIAVPAAVAGTTFWIQGGVLDPATFSLDLLTSWGMHTL